MRLRLAGMLGMAGVTAASLGLAANAVAAPSVDTLAGSVAPAATTTPAVGSVPHGTRIQFEVNLALSNPSGAAALAKTVSDPSSAGYQQYLTPAQWEASYSPTSATVHQVRTFLKASHFSIGAASADRMTIDASGSAARIEAVFGTQLSYHKVDGKKLILNTTTLSVPSAIASEIVGVSGISQTVASPDDTTGAAPVKTSDATPGAAKPPAGFRNAQPCSAYYGQILAASFPALPGGYESDAPYTPCGYTPSQIRGAYGLTSSSDDGTGQTVAIVDAYASPTLESDAQTYAAENDPDYPLKSSQFSELLAPKFDDAAECKPSGWYGEQTLDVEAVHATAPGANILFAGAENCVGGLNDTLQTIVDNHLAEVISNSYGDTGGDVTTTAGYRAATDDILEMAAGTGVSVLYSSGDDGDNYDQIGVAAPDYPAESPYATAVGGTSLEVGATDNRLAEYGWSTGKAYFCNADFEAAGGCKKSQLGTWLPLAYDYGGGGGTSANYIQPYYQAGVVPTALSQIHSSTSMRVIPDIAVDADPSTGFLIGETQTFGKSVYYDQYRIGGTSLASPLLAGIVARADQSAGGALGFLDPKLYTLSGNASAISDIVSPSSPTDTIRSDYLNGVNSADGIYYSARTFDYQGPESYCVAGKKPGSVKCTTAPVSLETSPGYDNMTGLGTPAAGFIPALAAK